MLIFSLLMIIIQRPIVLFNPAENFVFGHKYCQHIEREFSNLTDAKEKCSYNPLCQGVEDVDCKAEKFRLCYTGSRTYFHNEFCLYEKPGILISTKRF